MCSPSCGRTWLLAAETLQGSLLRAPVLGRGRRHFLLQGAMHALVPPVLLGMSGGDAFRHNPSLIHHTASRDNPASAVEAKGAPLSVRIARGSPYSRNAASKMA